ncbi:protein translocase subunit SecF [Shewanella sp. SR43-4]|jgi:preprotein translocase subunit SecF|uniref:Protein-export membrane protein SecF n=1 Tax=Shewanella vesiculosa TaxID=518738 RepID=A0ABV0FWK2_9GAMM|nr:MULTISPECIES: protein translocase subunit SecF [Shewanella]NCQ46989.1 protein translocase subunit SecF [Shewanella frigidimarina]MBB1318309.1 protein translocase subunit SecF [Shewanella sp. SR43-4]MBB1322773.1 protein translocase subunit SecF [Shewanella sp. SR43-8]MBB1391141.1 protein translocase subunit SecF [Shewanella sp. SG44-6]MBB1474475.1 protein translocase subunit SecF [Shewanella sp. SG41-3]|tara:strand:- start:7926 stop:8873 length:948 start_codon:yes stop_codon:yes gene_type:complete
MLQIFSVKNTVDFLRHAKIISIMSMLLVIASLGSLATQGINWGLDFTGGTVVEMEFSAPVDLNALRGTMTSAEAEGAVVQNFGSSRDILVRLPVRNELKSDVQVAAVLAAAQSIDAGVIQKRVEFVGPQVGKELAEQGGLAVIVALICILIYVSFRFEWRLAAGSVAALAHDVIVTLGVFSVLQLEFDLTVLAGLLTVVGYSLNDTIVVYDRIRENFLKMRKGTPEEIVNTSITQTMSRTVITTGTTLITVIALFLKGGTMIHGFATALLLGIFVGTYSSIYVASYLAVKLGINREHMLPVEIEKEGADQPSMMP